MGRLVLHLVQGTRSAVQKGGRKILFQSVQEAGRAGKTGLARRAMIETNI